MILSMPGCLSDNLQNIPMHLLKYYFRIVISLTIINNTLGINAYSFITFCNLSLIYY